MKRHKHTRWKNIENVSRVIYLEKKEPDDFIRFSTLSNKYQHHLMKKMAKVMVKKPDREVGISVETRSQNEIHRFTPLTLIHFYSMSRLFYTTTWLIDDTRRRKRRRKRRSRIIVGGGSESGIKSRRSKVKRTEMDSKLWWYFLSLPPPPINDSSPSRGRIFLAEAFILWYPLFNWFIDRDHGKDRKRRKKRK